MLINVNNLVFTKIRIMRVFDIEELEEYTVKNLIIKLISPGTRLSEMEN